MSEETRYRGTVQTFDRVGGVGTISLPDGRELTVRYSAILGEGVRCLERGVPVSFQIARTRRGLCAVRVQRE